jgi:glutamyl-tRNA synthetase
LIPAFRIKKTLSLAPCQAEKEKIMNQQEVIVRFPPSPTGYLHIGGARTAIFNWLYAQKTGGKLVLRIEDTDAERSSADMIQGIIDGLNWLGITWDVGPYYQSQYIQEHIAAARKLLELGHAYKCFCTPEELEKKREQGLKGKTSVLYDGACRSLTSQEIAAKEAAHLPYVIRLKVPRDGGAVVFHDLVYGTIEKKHEDLDDFVILRSNGQPLYVLSNAIDDIRDRITHVIRGADHLANTPKQILIYKALGALLPFFAHMPLTLDTQKVKISKRKHGETVAVHFYKEHGFIPWAFFNFLCLLGWSTSESQQIFSKEELIKAFTLEGIKRSNSIFEVRKDDPKFFTDPKAIAINAHYIRTMPIEEIAVYAKAELEKAGIWDPDYDGAKRDWFLKTLDLIRARFNFTTDFATLGRPYFSDDFPFEPEAVQKNILKNEGLKQWLSLLAQRLAALAAFDHAQTEEAIRKLAEELNIKAGILINALRTAVTGQAVGPGIFELLEALGQKRVVERLRRAQNLF